MVIAAIYLLSGNPSPSKLLNQGKHIREKAMSSMSGQENRNLLLKALDTTKKYSIRRFFPDQFWIYRDFFKLAGYPLNLKKPETFNEKIQWMKLNVKDEVMTECCDKYSARKYVAEKIGMDYLVPMIDVYEGASSLRFDKLPDEFALKATHGSSWNVFRTNRNQLSWPLVKTTFHIWEKMNYYFLGREWAYKHIKPRIICEKFLHEKGSFPKDYKIFCFSGNPAFIQVDLDRFSGHKRVIYDVDWRKIDVKYIYPIGEVTEKPERLDEMIEIARVLAKNFPFCRVDLYSVLGKIYFGELTFYPESGYGKINPIEYDVQWGSYLQLPTKLL